MIWNLISRAVKETRAILRADSDLLFFYITTLLGKQWPFIDRERETKHSFTPTKGSLWIYPTGGRRGSLQLLTSVERNTHTNCESQGEQVRHKCVLRDFERHDDVPKLTLCSSSTAHVFAVLSLRGELRPRHI